MSYLFHYGKPRFYIMRLGSQSWRGPDFGYQALPQTRLGARHRVVPTAHCETLLDPVDGRPVLKRNLD